MWTKKINPDGSVTLEARPMIVLRDSNNNPDVVFLIYCTTQNKELSYNDHILIEEGSEDFFRMGLDESTYIIPQIHKNMAVEAITGKRGSCSNEIMSRIDKVIQDWTLGKS